MTELPARFIESGIGLQVERAIDPNNPLHIAVHEAGHAVIARVLGVRLGEVITIVHDPKGGTDGGHVLRASIGHHC